MEMDPDVELEPSEEIDPRGVQPEPINMMVASATSLLVLILTARSFYIDNARGTVDLNPTRLFGRRRREDFTLIQKADSGRFLVRFFIGGAI
jgi:hypothetical protein